MRIVVTGANRGMGLELVRQLRDRGDEVEACARRPDAPALRALAGDRVRLHALDVTDATSVGALAAALGDAAIDIVWNVAATYSADGLPALAGDLALAEVAAMYEVNAIGALRVSLALLPHLRRGTARKLVHISSDMASIGDNDRGGAYAYRMSKAALNMMSRSLAADLRGERIVSVVINPGWVKTDLGGPRAPGVPEDSARGALALLLEPFTTTGRLFKDGRRIEY